MAFGTVQDARYGEAWDALTTLVADEGTARQPHAAALIAPGAAGRDLADAVHCLCMLHGRHPGIVEFAADRAAHPVAAAWMAEAVAAFAAERARLVRVVAHAGPLPSTPGQAETEAAIAAQRHALDMIAASDRSGCPLGATMALMLDWPSIRRVLDAVAERLGLEVEPPRLPVIGDAATVVSTLAATPAFERAMLFGAQQTLAQHRALWHLLEARSDARTHA
ncbi:hypothetical protein SAMN06297144_3020 [Sphingomonas guangdongensis]|uniref:Uncharacterized protein n=1 Tax=Sphingomonas guangdongensis TaxID=1141890 RepID=A0A285R682_9SPHN|nr:hypothetical protein [Sphingomonas guangdongensis]SOB87882.1 hypothetical protein SAMN06297144_3020 [Sphingomonas guangdongensis]